MARELKNIFKSLFINLLTKWLEDFLILIGLSFVVYQTYSTNITAGNYLVGFLFLLFGLLMVRKR